MLRLTILLHLVLLFVLAGCSSEESADAENRPAPADRVLLGGVIETVDDNYGTVQALAINDYRITAVGSDEEISAYIGEKTDVIELQGRFAMPGFIEGHGHFLALGESLQILDLTSIRDWDEAASMVATAADKAEPGEWILGRGWHQDKWDTVPEDAVDGVPRNLTLNDAAPDNPVLLEHASGHASMANAAALAAAGIDNDTDDPDGGTIVRAPDGSATGMLRETAQYMVYGALQEERRKDPPEETEQRLREQVYLAGLNSLSHGVTSFHDAGIGFEDIDFLKLLEQEGALPIRLYVMVRGETNERMDELLPHYLMEAEENDFLTVRSIKRQVDGAVGTHGAWLLDPYTDMQSTEGLVLETIEDIEGTARVAIKHGYQVNTHAIGDRANREILDLYDREWQAAGVEGEPLRWRIEHAQHVNPADLPRFVELGVIASMQGVHATSDGPWLPTRLGDERTEETSYRWKDFFDSGAIVTNGTDAPVESIDAVASFYSSVSRRMGNGAKFHEGQAMTRKQAIESYTINNAYAAFEEEHKGSLTPGKLADIVILTGNLMTVEEDQIPNIKVDMTLVGGEVAYER